MCSPFPQNCKIFASSGRAGAPGWFEAALAAAAPHGRSTPPPAVGRGFSTVATRQGSFRRRARLDMQRAVMKTPNLEMALLAVLAQGRAALKFPREGFRNVCCSCRSPWALVERLRPTDMRHERVPFVRHLVLHLMPESDACQQTNWN